MDDNEPNPLTGPAGPGFNWHEADRDSFLKWLVVTVMPRVVGDARFEEFREATTDFTDVRIAMQINGVPVNAFAFIDGVQRNMTHAVSVEAERIVREQTGFDELADLIHEADRLVKATLRKQLVKAGIELSEDEDRW